MNSNTETQQKPLRKWMYLIVEHDDEDKVGTVSIDHGRPQTAATKNKRGVRMRRNIKTNESWERIEVGLGTATFDSKQDYEDRIGDVIEDKLREIDESHLRDAGLDPDEVFSDE